MVERCILTSLAKYVYGLHFREFHTSSYIGDISRRCDEKFSGLLDLQKQLCDDISKKTSIQVHDVSTYTSKIENLVAHKKVLLVLDDIDSLTQLDALLGSRSFHPGSIVIVTTKDAWLTESCALFKTNLKLKHTKHVLKGLSQIDSQKLLCFHAFMSNNPNEGYEEVSENFVRYCEGHPLALEILGKSLHNRDVAYWEDRIKRLKKETGSPVNNVLRMSFDSLPSENDKELFKHIACFFVGIDRDVAETILKACDIDTRYGITNLIDNCLLSIGWNNEFMMHQLLQKMGRSIVHEESPDKPWKRSRLWCHAESFKVLKQKKGKGNLLGLALDMQMLEKEKLRVSMEVKTDALSDMDNLMLLQLNYVPLIGSYENFPEELRWLCMHGFPLKTIPLDLPMENLVALDLSYSNIESFGVCYSNSHRHDSSQKQLIGSCSKNKRLLGSLKILNLSFCEQLRSLSGFDELSALERLIVRNCSNLLEVSDSIEQCFELILIDLSYCIKLEKLPRSLGMLKKVKTLLLKGCNLGEPQIDTTEMDSMEKLKTNNIDISTLTSSSTVLEAIPRDLKFFAVSLPRSLVSLSLENNNLSTESFPMDFSCLSMLEELYLDENPIVSLPNCVRNLPRLQILSMQNCNSLTSIEHPPHTLRELILFSDYKPLLQKVLFDPKMSPLKFLLEWKMFATSSFEIEGMIKIQPMAGVEEKVISSLGWTNLEFLNERRVATSTRDRGYEESEIQMYYEFGIFSTIYGGQEMPNWITDRSTGPSISFFIPSSPNKLKGFNFCYVLASRFMNEKHEFVDEKFLYLPMIMIRNKTKSQTWIYEHYIGRVNVAGKCFTLLSHWMFGRIEMEADDHITITVRENPFHVGKQVTKECGVSLVYDDGEEEEDALGYYKSWNHIISGDLTPFQVQTGEYILSKRRLMLPYIEMDTDDIRFNGKNFGFRALSQK
ncbi:disease resistance protein RUN1 isoform X1 [Lactuca sativa]|uniref:disease resistance protein RUN1 isoform X1 n=1 Tax=Lactuca sativa TaxID=4236 RepID=UPI000CA92339|nr:disease resistance protein RUN1 isoform X1 [Lactuca sativa]XP_042758828.1 disease resistance protein RUN1 isoform X1 [Lactuca sativa]